MKRENGYYWVNVGGHNSDGSEEWIVAEYMGNEFWTLTGSGKKLPEKMITEIDENMICRCRYENTSEFFLIEEGWIDPMENHNADGYKPCGFMSTEKEAKEFCESKGFWTQNDCWSILDFIYKDGKMPKYKYTILNKIKI